MIILAIRHAETEMKWPAVMNSRQFDAAVKKYSEGGISNDNCLQNYPDERRIVWCSEEKRSYETAERMFPNAVIRRTALLNEVPICSSCDTDFSSGYSRWMLRGRLQWLIGHARQPETRKQSLERASRFLHLLEEKGEDCIIVGHGFFLNVFIWKCARSGYRITRGSLLHISHLERVRIASRSLHCGGCAADCLLTSPKCQTGKEKAAKRGIGQSK